MKYTTGPLSPLFNAIARLPLVGPHADAEVVLMRSGAKPLAMFSPLDPVVDELAPDVAAGRLICTTITRTLTQSAFAYSWDKDSDHAEARQVFSAYQALRDNTVTAPNALQDAITTLRDSKIASPAEYARIDLLNIFERSALTALNNMPSLLRQQFPDNRKIEQHLRRKNVQEFVEGRRSDMILPPHHFRQSVFGKGDFSAMRRLDQLEQDGQITCAEIECPHNDVIVLFGQPGQEDNMAELGKILGIIYDKPGKHAETVPPQREGQLLGYSDADINLFQRGEHPFTALGWVGRQIMQYTQNSRRDLRVAMMKEAGPNWSRNP